MRQLTINILNPKAEQQLQNLEAQQLITIEKPNQRLKELFDAWWKSEQEDPTLDEIQEVVEEVRAERYARKKV